MSDQQASAEKWTVLRLLQWTTDFFTKHGSDSPRLDAEVLLAHARQCSRIELYTAFEQEPDAEQRAAFRELVRRRGEGTPVAQLVGYKEFYSLRFRVNEHTLIPRPETEHLVIEALDSIKQLEAANKLDGPPLVADVGTGSGAIAIAFAVHCNSARVTAIDISEPALEIARWNAEQHDVLERIDFVTSDLFDAVQSDTPFSLILSNPPYVSEAEFEQLDRTVRDFEPKSALVSGPTGTETIERLMDQSRSRLIPGGRLIIELSPMIAGDCAKLAEKFDEYDESRFIKDLAGHRRVLSLKRA
ncbi:peptide chain release factor N(5)-glutamine methyltransferase [Rhodopirellula sp. MGV]|uniref:peptide chain release factor N(5)-glutamine methyltransferase n=1 Tax=Rhodopirellula sp. MGV TaxID=2023130 RepID=UPI000B9726E1|nr:peptide chain release factor N(5)-glutamine methyltransferase [Rhodopirellula sp. MGV]OYP29804.1 protein-(glutamine-N5) methyltransferase, release factor-specific [Rhodopirellula sp. MGV]PNY33689.1 peptide chain release factor N(5)-glutamine methyltransferase [Rhodopirellula baltica]